MKKKTLIERLNADAVVTCGYIGTALMGIIAAGTLAYNVATHVADKNEPDVASRAAKKYELAVEDGNPTGKSQYQILEKAFDDAEKESRGVIIRAGILAAILSGAGTGGLLLKTTNGLFYRIGNALKEEQRTARRKREKEDLAARGM